MPSCVTGELEDINARHGVKNLIGKGQILHVADQYLSIRQTLARNGREIFGCIEASDNGAPLPRQYKRAARPAANIKMPGSLTDLRLIEDGGEDVMPGRLATAGPILRP